MQPNISIRNLTKKFGRLTAVDDISLDIGKKEIFGLLGPNGAGKTTTINMICGLTIPTAGKIYFNNDPETNIATNKYQIGYCTQENIFYPKLTCHEQLLFMARMYGKTSRMMRIRAFETLELLGLLEKAHVTAEKLSGGMKRRLNICLAVIHDPRILILDEPEAGLDPQSRITVRSFIKLFSMEKTILLTTHNMDEADKVCDRLAIIDHGRILCLDTPSNLKSTIGEGDILEILIGPKEQPQDNKLFHLSKEDLQLIPKLQEKLAGRSITGTWNDQTVVLKSLNIVESIPLIAEFILENGFRIVEMKLRENSLEDVFIHLTGRRLRE